MALLAACARVYKLYLSFDCCDALDRHEELLGQCNDRRHTSRQNNACRLKIFFFCITPGVVYVYIRLNIFLFLKGKSSIMFFFLYTMFQNCATINDKRQQQSLYENEQLQFAFSNCNKQQQLEY